MWFLKLVLLSVAFARVIGNEEVTVTISQGTLKGYKSTTVTRGIQYYGFKGVPFSKPMVGPEKFDAPAPVEPWEGIWDATEHRAKCPYWCMMEKGVMGKEDCLYLNVYTTDLNTNAKKAVLVWFPSGGFNFGSGNDDMYGPDFFLDQDIILVTPNHRLGAIGFISTTDENAPGNVGLKDQSMALRWVQENIDKFGGDPAQVTIFGHSAGGAAVHYHLMSPMSKGLFRGAIMQSGSALAPWALNRSPKKSAFSLGKKLGINAKTSKELMEGLKKKSHEDIIIATKEVNNEVNPMHGEMYAFVPVIESNVGQHVFLPSDPWVLVKSGELADVPVMSGLVADEGAVLLPMFEFLAENYKKQFDKVIPDCLNISDPAARKMLGDNIKKFYFNGKDMSVATSEKEFIQLNGDIAFNVPQLISTKLIESRNKSPLYEYLFSYEAPFGIMKNLMGIQKYCVHGDETGYEFYSTAFKNKPEPNSPAQSMVEKMTKMWTNFAKEGNPTAKMDTDVNVQWIPMGKEGNYLNINVDLKMEQGLFHESISFWAKIYEDLLGDYASVLK